MAYFKRSLGICLWFMFLTLPLMVVRVNTISHEVEWRWLNMVWVGVAAFVISLGSQFWSKRREACPGCWKNRLPAHLPSDSGISASNTVCVFGAIAIMTAHHWKAM